MVGKMKISNEEYVAMQHMVCDLFDTINDISGKVKEIRKERQDNSINSYGEFDADFCDLNRIDNAITLASQTIKNLRDAITELME